MAEQTYRKVLLAGLAGICLLGGTGCIAPRMLCSPQPLPIQHAVVLTGTATEQNRLAHLASEAFNTQMGQKLLQQARGIPTFAQPRIQSAVLEKNELARYHFLTHTICINQTHLCDASKAVTMKTALLHEFRHALDLQAPALQAYLSNTQTGSPDHLFIICKLIELSARLQDIQVLSQMSQTPYRTDDAFFREQYQTARKNHSDKDALQITLTQTARAFWFKDQPVPLSDKMNRAVQLWNKQYNEQSFEQAFYDYARLDDNIRFTKAVSYLIEQMNLSISPQELTDPTRMNLKTTGADIIIRSGHLALNDRHITMKTSQNKLTNCIKTSDGTKEIVYQEGKLLSTRTFYPSGQLKSDTVYTRFTNGITQEKITRHYAGAKSRTSICYYDSNGIKVFSNSDLTSVSSDKETNHPSLKRQLAKAQQSNLYLPLRFIDRMK